RPSRARSFLGSRRSEGSVRHMMTARKTDPTAQLSAGAEVCNLPRSVGSISACPVIRSSCYHPDTRATEARPGHALQEAQRASHTNALRIRCAAYSRTDLVATRGSAGAARTTEGQT